MPTKRFLYACFEAEVSSRPNDGTPAFTVCSQFMEAIQHSARGGFKTALVLFFKFAIDISDRIRSHIIYLVPERNVSRKKGTEL